MADTFKGIITADGKKRQLPYENVLKTPVSDKTLAIEGAFADSKAVGDRFKEVNAETNSIKKDIGNLSSSKISKFYATNNGENHLADSDDGKIADMLVYGRSEQKSTTGAQLFDMSTAFAGWVGDDGTPRNDGTIGKADNIVSDYIPVESNTVYSCNNNNNIFVWEYDSSKTLIKSDGQLNSESFTTAENSKFIVFAVSYSSAQTPDYIKTIMFNKGSSVLPWEPYTGGQPSPSPDYPQEIKSVVNPTVKVCGKNLINTTLQTVTRNGVTCTANGDGTCTLNGTATSETDFYIYGRYDDVTRIPLDSRKTYIVKKSGNSNVMFHVGISDRYTVVASLEDGQIDRQAGISFFICRIVSGATLNNFTIYPQIEEGSASTDFEPYHEQTVTLPYTLNAIPVESGGNVVIDGQQYIADYVDVERGKLVRCIGKKTVNGTEAYMREETWNDNAFVIYGFLNDGISYKNYTDIADITSDILTKNTATAIANDGVIGIASTFKGLFISLGDEYNTIEKTKEYFSSNNTEVYYILATSTENDLTPEEITAFKALATYYPVTNISVNSEQLDGLTVFNYPISLANGWNYVKQQLNDNRDYIYDMGTKTQDIDTQSAEAYVNSEYAVALIELEV